MKNIGKPRYGIIDNGLFGLRVVSGIITGIRYTEDKPVYEISFGHNKWWTSLIYEKVEELAVYEILQLASPERIIETHGLKIKYGNTLPVNIIPDNEYVENCKFYDYAQGREKCTNDYHPNRCGGICHYFENKKKKK